MSGYQIQRLSFSGMLDQSFRLLRDHFVAITVPFIVVYVPYALTLELLGLDKVGADLDLLLSKLAVLGGMLLVFTVGLSLAQLVVTHVIADCYLGKRVDELDALRRSLRSFMAYIGTTLLVYLALMLLTVLILTIPVAIYFFVAWSLIGPVVVVEKVYGPSAMKRSRALVKGHFWETVAMLIVSGLLAGMASGGLTLLFKFIPVIGPVLTGVVDGVTVAYMSAVVVVLYVDLRCRHEDFDLQLLARQIASGGPQAALPAAQQGTDARAG